MNVRVQKSEPPESKEILAAAILKIAGAAQQLHASGLNRRAVVVLLQDATKLGKKEIETVLDALPRLAGWYCK